MIKAIEEQFPVNPDTGVPYATLRQATVKLVDMGERSITTQIKIDGDVTPDFSTDWVAFFKGEKYIHPLRKPQGAKENTSLDSTIDLTFQHWAIYQLKRWPMFSIMKVSSGTVSPDKYIISLNLNLANFCDLFAQVLYYYYGDSIIIDLNPGWSYKPEPTNVQINYTYIWDVLIKFYELYGVRWSIEPNGSPDKYVIKVGYPSSTLTHIFEYGFDGGLLKVERQVQNDDIRNMILGRGGETNIPYCYFKAPDSGFLGDPDWIPELADIYFSEIRGATFRSYVQGWRARHYNGQAKKADAYAPWAWEKGYTDEKFDPVEYVKDDDSIEKYGPLMGGLENNSETYPTIQGVNSAEHLSFFKKDIGRVDQVVAVEEVQSDEIADSAEADSRLYDLPGGSVWNGYVLSGQTVTIPIVQQVPFTVEPGRKTNLQVKNLALQGVINYNDGTRKDFSQYVELVSADFSVRTRYNPPLSVPPVGIPAGDYYYTLTVTVKNNYSEPISILVDVPGVVATSSNASEERWNSTFNIWIKNIWATSQGPNETNAEYADRVWKPILGDHLGNDAKVIFSSGMLSTSEDYEFVITKMPELDTSKSYAEATDSGRIVYDSHWKLTLAKSDADLDSLGVYVPSTTRQGAAGDYFYFTGIDLPHPYVVWAEEDVDNYKSNHLREVCDIKPTWVVSLDKVRCANGGAPDALIDQLKTGCAVRLADKRFIVGDKAAATAYETLYLQSITYIWNEVTSDNAGLIPDVEVVLSDKYETVADPVATLSGEVSSLGRQMGSLSNVEQIVRAIGDKVYLRKDGIPDRSVSPSEFASLLTSLGFREGMVGGAGWGFFRDANGAWVLETDKINVRQDLQVNNLVINQISARGGMIVESAAAMEVTRVVNNGQGDYICYFDQKNGTVVNLFQENDIGYCSRFSPDYKDVMRSYKREVIEIGENFIVLAGDYPPNADQPIEGDVIVQWGNTINPARQFVIVRDVVNGGYERFIEGLDDVDADGTEYFFVGRQVGMYGSRPRFYLGDKNGYIEYVNGQLTIKGRFSVNSTIGDQTIGEYIKETAGVISPAIIDLTNEIQALACDSSGKVLSGLPAQTYVRIYQNGVAQTDWSFELTLKNAIANIDTTTGLVTIWGIENGASTASVEITASKAGHTELSATFSVYKVIPGKEGESAVLYELGMSVNNVTKNVDGTLSTQLVKVTKYKVDGSGRKPTTDKWLRYSYENTTTQNALASPDGGTSSIDIGPIPDNATALVLTLYDGSSTDANILDRERIPILTDASGLEVGGTNLLRNTNQGTRMWTASFPARSGEVDEETSEPVKSKGEFVIVRSDISKGIRAVNEAATTDTGWQLIYYPIVAGSIKDGVPYMLSFRAKAGRTPVSLSVQLRSPTESNYLSGQVNVSLSPMETRYEIPIKITKVPDDGVSYAVCFYIQSPILWTEIDLWDLKLEVGNVATEWSPAPGDFDYLTAALAESTVTDGGLILTSLIKVGTQTDPDTLEQNTMAGISGLVDSSPDARGGIAIWAGGDMIDLDNPSRNPSATPATTVIRQDGSAYFANNTIRFAKDVVEVGDNVVLNKDGLVLNDSNGKQRLKVANVPVGNDIDIDVANINISMRGSISPWLQLKSRTETIKNPGVGGLPGTIDVVTRYWWAIVGGTTSYRQLIPGELTPGATITLRNCSVEIDTFIAVGETTRPLEGRARFRVGYYDTDGKEVFLPTDIGYVNFKKKSGSASIYIAELSSLYIPSRNVKGGHYFVDVSLVKQTLDNSGYRVKTASVSVDGTAYNAFDSTTVLGNDGLLTIWDKVGLLVNKDKIIMRAGSVLLRVSSSGIEKSSNGGISWSSL